MLCALSLLKINDRELYWKLILVITLTLNGNFQCSYEGMWASKHPWIVGITHFYVFYAISFCLCILCYFILSIKLQIHDIVGTGIWYRKLAYCSSILAYLPISRYGLIPKSYRIRFLVITFMFHRWYNIFCIYIPFSVALPGSIYPGRPSWYDVVIYWLV